MASATDVQWSEEVYTIKKLVDLPGKYYPLIVLVVEGYYGQDDIETLATNQMARFQMFVKQKRVLAKDRKGRILSIPASFPIRFQLAKESARSNKSHTLQKILDSNKLPVTVKFESKTKWRFRVGSVKHSTSNFGPIEITSTYEACFLAGNSIHNGVIDPKVMLVPVHIEATVRLARGLKSGTRAEWENMKKMYSTAVAGADFDKIEGTRAIMLYPSNTNKSNLPMEKSYPIYFTSGESTITNMSTQSFESESSLYVMKRNTNLVLSIDRDKMMDGIQGSRRGHSLSRNSDNDRRGIGSRQSGYESDTTIGERRPRPVHRMAVGDTISQNVVNVTLPANDGTVNDRASRHARFYDRSMSAMGVSRVMSPGYPVRRTSSLDGIYMDDRRYRRNESASSTIPRAIRTRSYKNYSLKMADPRLSHSEKDLRFVTYDDDYHNGHSLYSHPQKVVSFASPAIVRSNSMSSIYVSQEHLPVMASSPPPLDRNAPVSVIQTQPPPQPYARETTFGMVHNQTQPPPQPYARETTFGMVHNQTQPPSQSYARETTFGMVHNNTQPPPQAYAREATFGMVHNHTQPPPQAYAREATFGMVHNQPGPPALRVIQAGPHEHVHPPSYPSIVAKSANVQTMHEFHPQGSYLPSMVNSAPGLSTLHHHPEHYLMDGYTPQTDIPTYYTVGSGSHHHLGQQVHYSVDYPSQPYQDHSQHGGEDIYSTIPIHEDEGHTSQSLSDIKASSSAYIRRPGLERGSKIAFATSTSIPKMIGSKVVRSRSFNSYDNRYLQNGDHVPPQLIRPGILQNGFATSDSTDGQSREFMNGNTVHTQFIPTVYNNTGGVKYVTNTGETSVRVMNAASNENVVYQGTLKFSPSVDGDDDVESYVERMEVHQDLQNDNNYTTAQSLTTEEAMAVTTNGGPENNHDWPELGRRKLRDIPSSYTRYEIPIEYDNGIQTAKWRTGPHLGSSLDSRASKVKNGHGGYRQEIRHNGYNSLGSYDSKNRFLHSNGMTTFFPTPGSDLGVPVDVEDTGSGVYAVVNKQEQSHAPPMDREVVTTVETTEVSYEQKDDVVEGNQRKEDESSSITSTSSMTTESSHNQRKDSAYSPNKITHEVLVHDNVEYKQYTYNYSPQSGDFIHGEPHRHDTYEKRTSGMSVGSDNRRVFVRNDEKVEEVVKTEGETNLQRAPSMNSLRDVIHRRGTPSGSLRQKLAVAPISADKVFSDVLNSGEATRTSQTTEAKVYHQETITTTAIAGQQHQTAAVVHVERGAVENGEDTADEEPILARVRHSILELDAYLKAQGGDSQTQSEHSSKLFDQFGRMALNNEITTL